LHKFFNGVGGKWLTAFVGFLANVSRHSAKVAVVKSAITQKPISFFHHAKIDLGLRCSLAV